MHPQWPANQQQTPPDPVVAQLTQLNRTLDKIHTLLLVMFLVGIGGAGFVAFRLVMAAP